MKYQDITFRDITASIFHHWKTMALIILVCLIIGVASGILCADKASAEGSGSAETWVPIDLASITPDLQYYNNCLSFLNNQSNNLHTYVNTVYLDDTITDEQSKSLLSLDEEITKYQQKVLSDISKDLSAVGAFYIPSSLREEAIAEYTDLRDITQDQLFQAEQAMTILQSIGGLNSTDETINSTYASLLSQAANYAQLQLNLDQYESILDRLETDYVQVQSDSQQMDTWLEEASAELNTLGQRCYQTVDEIARQNHLEITAADNDTELTVKINHTNRLATRQEAFTAFVLFFGLVGICVGIFAAIWRECFLQNKKAHQQ